MAAGDAQREAKKLVLYRYDLFLEKTAVHALFVVFEGKTERVEGMLQRIAKKA